ncbi:NADH:flavin oxidoreductase/NADH oxidase [Mycetocola reblochoni]|uniref:Oxidoreductase n=2 Tax=Mycetocola reblochoni TaxID=331618 RepID=A0A1R4JUX6_9MICO|nr:NADH:flavin oxidoreductase/NADH oxidase [Mycetocola reblochoni]RLP71119.1 NADH:flavin oxidoreductase/NADH oxidase [Mycetocola reblochoni]SJN35769.1 oxidoreductase [Mycetocola reblochoni REB411]
MPRLVDPIVLRDTTIPTRVWMSPMCMYSADATGDRIGQPGDFHLGHYAARAAGGAGLVVIEATAVVPEGRISPYDLGIWSDEQVPAHRRLTAAIASAGAVPGIQLAHAGRKASIDRPQRAGVPLGPEDGGWRTVGPSPVAFPGYPVPAELDREQIAGIVAAFGAAARRALDAGFVVAEIHGAHGYLLHEFLSPLSNTRTDEYGGSFDNRVRLVLEVVDAVRAVWPEGQPVLLRLSSTDWVEESPDDDRDSWTVEQTARLAALAAEHGVDLVDVSSGGNDRVAIPADVDYQTVRAAVVRRESGVPVAAVGRITGAGQAQALLDEGDADALFVGRALLADPSWPNLAAVELGDEPRYLEQYAYVLPRPRA